MGGLEAIEKFMVLQKETRGAAEKLEALQRGWKHCKRGPERISREC